MVKTMWALLVGAWIYPLIPTGDVQLLSAIPFAVGVSWAVTVMAVVMAIKEMRRTAPHSAPSDNSDPDHQTETSSPQAGE